MLTTVLLCLGCIALWRAFILPWAVRDTARRAEEERKEKERDDEQS
jgi:hypothetical protein